MAEPAERYLATVTPGLEEVLASELATKLPGLQVQASWRGRLLVAGYLAPEEMTLIRTANNLYHYLGAIPVGRHRADLSSLARRTATLNWDPVTASRLYRRGATAWVSCSRTGKHTYSRFDAATAALVGICRACRLEAGTADKHDFEFRLDIQDTVAHFSLRLTPTSFRFRGRREFQAAALLPPVAHALVWLSSPQPDDVFLDPFCGSGTIVAERCAYEAAAVVGSDISPAALAVAKENVPDYVSLQCWDAGCLQMAAGSVSCFVTNPPWGKQIEVSEGIAELYTRFCREAERVLASDGRAVILTDKAELLEQAAQQAGLTVVRAATVSLHGIVAGVWMLTAAS
jgi:tRNA (guanine6-N2)-methyltransferase